MKAVLYFKEVKEELSKVKWPSQGQVLKLTMIVIFISLLVAVVVGALDFTFAKVLEIILS